MQFFDRSKVPPPGFLKGKRCQNARAKFHNFLAQDVKELSQTRMSFRPVDLHHPDVKTGLERLFRTKCSFCESFGPTEPHRFRPAQYVNPSTNTEFEHLHYIWLSESWQNLYSICDECKPKDEGYFPVKGKRVPVPSLDQMEEYIELGNGSWRSDNINENELLLDPCRSLQFHKHLYLELSGYINPIGHKASLTIEYFRLNRPSLVRKRLSMISKRRDKLLEALGDPGHFYSETNSFQFDTLEYGGLWYVTLRNIAEEVKRSIGEENVSALKLGPSTIKSFYEEVAHHQAGHKIIQKVFDQPIQEIVARNLAVPVLNTEVLSKSSANESVSTQKALKHINIENFKSIESLSLEFPIPPANLKNQDGPISGQAALMIIGENAVGKSSILEAIALALSKPDAVSILKQKPESFPLNPKYLGANELKQRAKSVVKLTYDDESSETLEISGDGAIKTDGSSSAQVFAYGAFRQFGPKPGRRTAHSNIRSLFHSDYLLPNPQKWLLRLSDMDFDMVVRALRPIFSIEKKFEVIERDQDAGRCLVVTATDSKSEPVKTPMDLVSSGFRAVLAVVCDVFYGLMRQGTKELRNAEAVVLIDEIEAHLHPRWKLQILDGLRRSLPRVTFIVTTHDPLCLRSVAKHEAIVLNRIPGVNSDETNLPTYIETIAELPNLELLTVEQLLTSDFFQLFSTDAHQTDLQFARVADLLARQRAGENLKATGEDKVLAEFTNMIHKTLQIGSTEAERLVQEAVADYLSARMQKSTARMKSLRAETKSRIVEILGQY